MPRTHVAVVALSLALAAIAGTVALTETIRLGQARAGASSAAVAQRTAELDRFEASLRAELRKTPPPVPKLPPASAVPAVRSPATPSARTQRVVYVRPAPIVVHARRSSEHEDGAERERGEGADD